jgi:hypothetical protein
MITDFLKSMSPVDPNPPPRVPYIWCGEVGCGEVGCGVWGVGCGVWGSGVWGSGVWGVGCGVWEVGRKKPPPVSCLLSPES